MNNNAASILAEAHPGSHIVYPCADEALIAQAVGTFARSGISKGEAVILVTTEARKGMIERHLTDDGLDITELQKSGQLAFFDAAELLSTFLMDGMPDATRFKNRVGLLIARANVNPFSGQPRRVRIFGEMVSLLYAASNIPAAARLEEFWNEVIRSYSISLFCAYSLGLDSNRLPQPLLDCHSHNLSALAGVAAVT